MSAPRPLARGELSRTPLLHVLLSLERRGLSGTLVLWPEAEGKGQDRVLVERGWPVAARFVRPASSMEVGLLAAFARRSGPYAFYREDLVGEGEQVLRGRVDPWTLAAASLRVGVDEGRMNEVLDHLGETTWRLRPGVPLQRLKLLREEEVVLDLLRATPSTVRQILAMAPDRERARRLLYLLGLLDALEPYGGEAASRVSSGEGSVRPRVSHISEAPSGAEPASGAEGGDPTPASGSGPEDGAKRVSLRRGARAERPAEAVENGRPPSPPADLAPRLRERWERLVAEIEAAREGADPFDLLGLEPVEGITDAEVERAYLQRARACHPDSLPEPLRALEPWARRLFQQVTEARDRLRDAERRARALQMRREGRDEAQLREEERRAGAIVEATLELAKIEVLVRRQQLPEAFEALERLRRAVPDHAETMAWWAHVLDVWKGSDPTVRDRVEGTLREALVADPECWRAHLWLGQLLRRAERWSEALAHFERAAGIVPKDIEVQRELRVARLKARGGGDEAGPGGGDEGGWLGRFFGRKKS